MITPVHLSQILAIDVGIDLRRGNIRVSEHFLHRPEVRSPLQEMRCEGMTEGMGVHALGDAAALDILLQDLPRPHAGERLAPRVQKERLAATTAGGRKEPWSQLACIYGESGDGAAADWHQPLLASLSKDANQALFEHDVARADADPFGYAQSRPVRELEHRAVSEIQRIVHRRRRQQRPDLRDREDLGERAPPLGCIEPLTRVARHDAVAYQEPEVAPDRRDVSPYG